MSPPKAPGHRGHAIEVLRRNLSKALRERRLAAAGDLLEQLRSEDPFAVETRGLELQLLIRSGRHSEAEALSRELVELFPASARIWKLAGEASYRRKDYRAAEERLRESDRLHPHWSTRRLLGQALTQMGRFDDAEAILAPLAAERDPCHRDLAWLYERKGDDERALAAVEAHLERYPDDPLALDQRLRLRARRLSAEELLEEASSLEALGEEVSPEILGELVGALLRAGRPREAHSLVERFLPRLEPRACARIGWVCRKLEAHDLAFGLFGRAFPHERGNVKFLNAFELVAKRSGRLDELIHLYEEHAPQSKNLYGRMKRLARTSRGA